MKNQKKEALQRIVALLESFQMIEYADQLIETYSQGMRRKITLCAALLHNPQVIFLDEPTSGLDAASAKVAKDLFRKHADQGAAVLFTTHVLEIAERLCDRIGIVYQGHLKAEGTFDELKAQFEKPGSSLEEIYLNITEVSEKNGE